MVELSVGVRERDDKIVIGGDDKIVIGGMTKLSYKEQNIYKYIFLDLKKRIKKYYSSSLQSEEQYFF